MSLHQYAPNKFTVQVSKADPLRELPNRRWCKRVKGLREAQQQEALFLAEAEQWQRDRQLIKEAQVRGLVVQTPNHLIPTGSTELASYLESVYLPWAKDNLEPSTFAARASSIMVLAEDLGTTPLDQIEHVIDSLISTWKSEGRRYRQSIDSRGRKLARKPKKISDAGINERLKILRAILGHAHKKSRILQHQARISMVRKKRALPGESKSVRYFTIDERALFLRYADEETRLVFQVGVLTGMRPAEIFHMLVSWIDFARNKIVIQESSCLLCKNGSWLPKTGEFRSIDIAPDLLPILRRLTHGKPANALVIDSKHGRPFSALRGSGGSFATTLKRAGIKRLGLSAYSMRHTAAADLITAGRSVHEVAAFLGNSARTCELHYAHLIPTKGAGIAAILKSADPICAPDNSTPIDQRETKKGGPRRVQTQKAA